MAARSRCRVSDRQLKGEQVRAYSRGGEIIALLSCDPARGGWKPDKVLVPL